MTTTRRGFLGFLASLPLAAVLGIAPRPEIIPAGAKWYIWRITSSYTGQVDTLYSSSDSNPTIPAGYDRWRLVGTFDTNHEMENPYGIA